MNQAGYEHLWNHSWGYSSAVFVGRERELTFLERRLAEALGGEGGIALVEGEAGAGKTALAHALTRRARADGVRTAWGACLEGEGAAPYQPWTQILRSLGLPDPDPAGDSRQRLFDEVAQTIRTGAAPGLLLVIDDLHWADPSSLALLQVIAVEAADVPLLLVGLYRGPEPSGALRSVLRQRASSHLALGGLSTGEVGRLAAWTLGHDLGEPALAGLRHRSGGNPLFVLELLKLMEATGQAEAGLPRGIREVIEQRADRLGAPASRALSQAAVLGREFSLDVFATVTGEPPDVLDEAVSAGLIHLDGGRGARFSHALIQEVLYARLGAAERKRLHALAAQAVEPYGTIESLAHHLRQAGEHERALEATLEAARQASTRLAYEHAALQYGEALALPGAAPHRAELLLELARCQFRSGDVEASWDSCRQAADLGRASGQAEIVADAATVLRGIENFSFSPVNPQIHALCRQALAMLDGSDPVRQARLLAQLAITADPWAGDAEPDLGERALAAAETTGDPDTLRSPCRPDTPS